MTTRTEQKNNRPTDRVVVVSSSSGARARTREGKLSIGNENLQPEAGAHPPVSCDLVSDRAMLRLHLAKIRQTYRFAIGQEMPPILDHHVIDLLRSGAMDAYQIRYGLQEAAFAPRPSWKYAEAVARRLVRDGITGEDIIFDLIELPEE